MAATKTTKYACPPTEHNFMRLSDQRAICSRCGEFRTASSPYYFDWTYRLYPNYVGVPYFTNADNITISAGDNTATTLTVG